MPTPLPRLRVPIDHDLPARLERIVCDLALPAGRRVGHPGHQTAEVYVAAHLQRSGLAPYRGDSHALPYRSGGVGFTNFAGVIPGRDPSLPPILIGAHYDSVIDAPCADDNAAALALTFEVAAALPPGRLQHDVVVAIFDAEEPPHFLTPAMGSIRFYEDQTDRRGFHVALISDLIGHDVTLRSLGDATPPDIRRLVCVLGAESHPALPPLLDTAATPAGIGAVSLLNAYAPDLSDHHIFRVNDHPYLFFSCGHWEHYHRRSDTPEKLNYAKLAALTRWVTELIPRLDATDLAPPTASADDAHDPSAPFEARSIARALSPDTFARLDLPTPLTRAGVNAFVRRLLAETTQSG
jgi:hypothetical protein